MNTHSPSQYTRFLAGLLYKQLLLKMLSYCFSKRENKINIAQNKDFPIFFQQSVCSALQVFQKQRNRDTGLDPDRVLQEEPVLVDWIPQAGQPVVLQEDQLGNHLD